MTKRKKNRPDDEDGGTCGDTTSKGGYRCICPDSVQYFVEDRLRDLGAKLGLSRHKMLVGTGFADFSYDESYKEGCELEFADAVVALNVNMNFLIAILVCLAVILMAVIVMAMYRRRRTTFSDKDIDCDIRENIINYEDEGGGEGDQTGYDLSVLRFVLLLFYSMRGRGDSLGSVQLVSHWVR